MLKALIKNQNEKKNEHQVWRNAHDVKIGQKTDLKESQNKKKQRDDWISKPHNCYFCI